MLGAGRLPFESLHIVPEGLLLVGTCRGEIPRVFVRPVTGVGLEVSQVEHWCFVFLFASTAGESKGQMQLRIGLFQ